MPKSQKNLEIVSLGFQQQFLEAATNGRERDLSPTSLPWRGNFFKTIAAYCYGSLILMNPFSIAALRCVAEFLEMTVGNFLFNSKTNNLSRTETDALFLTQDVNTWKLKIVC